MEANVEKLINVHKASVNEIKELEETIAKATFSSDKDKVNFGNLCTALTGFRLVNDAMTALLANEDIIVTDDGSYFEKIDEVEQKSNDNKDNE